MNKTSHLNRNKQIKTKTNMKTNQKKKIASTQSATTNKKQKNSYDKLFNVLSEKKSMTLKEMETKLQEIKVRFFESMDKYELWLLTREMLYLKYAIGKMKKHWAQNLVELDRCGFDRYEFAFSFPMGRMYPNGMAVMSEGVYTWTDNAQMIRDLLAILSPHLTEAEQMLFKFAICEENFNPETDEDKLY
jgi:hypothetical protein